MRLIRPRWLAHGDGVVRIWSTDAILHSDEADYDKPRLLASLNNHAGTVHVVRFAPNNKYLASGADDRVVCVYAHDPSAPSTAALFGSKESAPRENWRVFRRLVGHENDVQDLAWSPDSSILASVGLDAKVVVWSGQTFEKLRTVGHHTSLVKGIAFDPANKHFATASDDRTVKVFDYTSLIDHASGYDRSGHVSIERTVSAPFKTSPLTAYFRRLSWSPDGQFIAGPNAVNGPVSTVCMISRGDWTENIALIGHELPVEVCAFSPRLYHMESSTLAHVSRMLAEERAKKRAEQQAEADKASGKPPAVPPRAPLGAPPPKQIGALVACGGQDRTLSLWTTGEPRPLLVIFDLALKAITDLAWSPDGRQLYVTSLDGGIRAVQLTARETGECTAADELETTLSKYGGHRKGAAAPDGPRAFSLEEGSRARERADGTTPDPGPHAPGPATATAAAASPSRGLMGPPPPPPRVDKLKQRVTFKNGKKRVAPLLVAGSGGPASSVAPPSSSLAGSAHAGAPAALDRSAPFDALPAGGLASLLMGNKRKLAASDGADVGHAEKRLATAARHGAVPILVNGVAGLAPPAPAPDAGHAPAPAPPAFLRPALVDPSLAISQIRLAVPKVRNQVLHALNPRPHLADDGARLPLDPARGDEEILHVRNPGPAASGPGHERPPARIAVTCGSHNVWLDFLRPAVLLTTGTEHFWAAACEDGSLYVWTPAGRRMLNAIVLESQPVLLESDGWWLMCLTAVGMCHVWSLRTQTALHPPVSLGPILNVAVASFRPAPPHLQAGPAVTSARIYAHGKMVVTLNNGDGYTYAPEMLTWQRLTEPWWAVGSQYWNGVEARVEARAAPSAAGRDGARDRSAGIIPYLERRTTMEVLARRRSPHVQQLMHGLFAREGFESLEKSVSVGHLENRLAAALLLEAKHDFRANLVMYAHRIGTDGLRVKVEELLRSLLGGLYPDDDDDDDDDRPDRAHRRSQATSKGWASQGETLCGWNRRELLTDVIVILGKFRDLHRTVMPYARVAGVTKESTGAAGVIEEPKGSPADAAGDVEMSGVRTRSPHLRTRSQGH
ncbi:MAG: HIR complex subunit [Phylliscum demangeonii]|nr:MAG: HIR complex subunit [Phylliscum demangeonii]